MNGLCSGCGKPVEVVDFRLGEGLLLVRCPACGKEQRLSVSAEAPKPSASVKVPMASPSPAPPQAAAGFEALFDVLEGFCPKCVAPRVAEATSCPSCGLTFARAPAPDVYPSSALRADFHALVQKWGEEPAHGNFLQQAAANGELASAARLYRIRLAQAPSDAAAKAALEKAVRLASAPVSVEAIRVAPKAEQQRQLKVFVLGLLCVVFPGVLFLLFKLLGAQ
jgi:predicted amidophosphoribosyltransferase